MFKRLLVLAVPSAALYLSACAVEDMEEEEVELDESELAIDQASFQVKCFYSHSNSDDPIVSPRDPGAAHLHDFFGNRTTNAFSTYSSLLAGATNCIEDFHATFDYAHDDHAPYWAPALLKNGRKINPSSIDVYYFVGNKSPASIRPFPPNFRMIAGDSKATAPQPTSVVWWSCKNAPGLESSTTSGKNATMPYCADVTPGFDEYLMFKVNFPDCAKVDTQGRVVTDSFDHKSHVTYSRRIGDSVQCPSTHPASLPVMTMVVRYPGFRGGAGTTFSSGGQYSGHADFINAWVQSTLENLVRRCLNNTEHCG